MPYLILDADIAAPKPGFDLPPGKDGLAVIFRYDGVPVEFWISSGERDLKSTASAVFEQLQEEILNRAVKANIGKQLIRDSNTRSGVSLSIAICTKDRPESLDRCLESVECLPAHEIDSLRSFEVLVVDNAPSDDRTRDLVSERPRIRYINEPKVGLNFARNVALSEARGDIVAFLDDDVVVDRGWLKGLATAISANPGAGLYTGQVLPYELETDAQILFEQGGGFRRGFDRVHYSKSFSSKRFYPCCAGIFGTGANMAVRREVALELGGFDIALDTGAALPGGGDLDMFYRMIRAQRDAVYEPGFLIFHEHRRDMESLSRQYRDSWGAAHMAFAIKSYKNDPSNRSQWRKFIAWWLLSHIRHVVHRLVNDYPLPVSMILARLSGSVVGLLGGYERSVQRVTQIERRVT